jgi:asparagine synthase (glutamine-hydrolysing)
MQESARGATIAFNGEIYNWKELQKELSAKGYVFKTPTDTEVVLYAYLEWGPACLERFNGMFAIAIWHDDRLFLARDRMGKKPLFYVHGPRGLGFASELKALRELDFCEVPICQALEFYFDEHTPFRNVKSLRPGEYLLYSPDDNKISLHRYFSFPEPQERRQRCASFCSCSRTPAASGALPMCRSPSFFPAGSTPR